MSANPPNAATPPQEPAEQQYMTEEDEKSQWASVLWYDTCADSMETYQNQFVAIFDKRIIAAAPTEEELGRRLDALGNTIHPFRVVVRYVRSAEGPIPL